MASAVANSSLREETRYVVNPLVDCLVVPQAPFALTARLKASGEEKFSRRRTMGDEMYYYSTTTDSPTTPKQNSNKSQHDRRTKKDKSRHTSKHVKERRTLRDEYKRMGDSLFQSRAYTDAIEQYTFALTLDPKSHIILSNRSAAYYKQGDKDKALEDARAAVEANPKFTVGYGRLACTLQKMKQWEGALEAFTKMLELEPENAVAQRGIETCSKRVRQVEQQVESDSNLDGKLSNQTERGERRRYSTGSNRRPRSSVKRWPSSHAEEQATIAEEPELPVVVPPSSSSDLSELSKQLRLLQAANKTQATQNERLERQLQIMSELKGISVAELRCELRQACRNQADAELQAQVASLRVEVETYADQESSTKKNADSFQKDAAEKKIANLQLRVGELEEVETVLRRENNGLYARVRDEASKASLLSATCTSQKEYIAELLNSDDEEKSETAQEKRIEELSELLRKAEVKARIESDRADLLESESDAREKTSKLRKEQFECRLNVQDQRIKDLEQQLSSLYAACEILRDDTPPTVSTDGTASTENSPAPPSPVPRSNNQGDTDSIVARRMQDEIDSEHHRRRGSNGFGGFSYASMMTPVPHFSDAVGEGNDGSTMPSAAWSNARDVVLPEKVVSGFLWKLDRDEQQKWSKQYFVLQGSYGNYQLSYSEGPMQRARCELGLITNVSTVAQCDEFREEQPHALVVHMDPGDPRAPIVYAGASSQRNLNKWLKALREVSQEADKVGRPDVDTAFDTQRRRVAARRHSCR